MKRRVTKDKLVYSDAFKQKVVSEIIQGKFSVEEARKVYDIRGTATLRRWMVAQGKSEHLGRVVRIETKDEKDRIRELEKQIRDYHKVISNLELKILYQDTLLKIGKEKYGLDLKNEKEVK
jgi:transposase-like protein